MKLFEKGNWGLRLLALILAVIVYHALKNESANGGPAHDRSIFKQH